MTTRQVLLFKNEANIQDEDLVEIMKEVLHYIEAPAEGVSGYHVMKSGGEVYKRFCAEQSIEHGSRNL